MVNNAFNTCIESLTKLWKYRMTTVYAHIFRESNFSRIRTLRHFREWLNSRSKSAMNGEFSIRLVVSCALHVHCVKKKCVCMLHSCVGSEVNIFLRVVNFASSTRLAKFTKIKPSRNIWRIQYIYSPIPSPLYCSDVGVDMAYPLLRLVMYLKQKREEIYTINMNLK